MVLFNNLGAENKTATCKSKTIYFISVNNKNHKFGVTPVSSDVSKAPASHGLNKVMQESFRNIIPYLNKVVRQLLDVMVLLQDSNQTSQFVQDMFNWIEVRTAHRPIHVLHVVLLKLMAG